MPRRCSPAGAEKISVNSRRSRDPELIDALSRALRRAMRGGRHRQPNGRRRISRAAVHRRRQSAPAMPARSTLDWVLEAQRRGAGEIVLNCMSSDGVRQGYDIEQLRAVRARLPRAAGGLGRRGLRSQHFARCVPRCGRRCGAGRERVSFRGHRHSRSQAAAACGRHRGENMSESRRTRLGQGRGTVARDRAGSPSAARCSCSAT